MNNKKTIFSIAIILVLLLLGLVESKTIQKLVYPKKYEVYVQKYSKEFDLDENLVYSVIKAESKFKEDAISHKGAKGLMQISDITRDWAIEELKLGNIDIFDPETNIKIGCWYLDRLYKEFGNLNLVIAAYNGGSGNVTKWLNNSQHSRDGENLDNIPFEETSNYLRKVLTNYKNYNKIYDEEGSN